MQTYRDSVTKEIAEKVQEICKFCERNFGICQECACDYMLARAKELKVI